LSQPVLGWRVLHGIDVNCPVRDRLISHRLLSKHVAEERAGSREDNKMDEESH
jgi:hypothetical protein